MEISRTLWLRQYHQETLKAWPHSGWVRNMAGGQFSLGQSFSSGLKTQGSMFDAVIRFFFVVLPLQTVHVQDRVYG